MMGESKSNSRVAFALLCGLAVCCSVMYITSDGAEVVLASEEHVGSGQDIYDPKSVESFDVEKTGLLYTKTPDTIKKSPEGRERLLTFLEKIEANIAKEVESRKEDIDAIRARMAKNMQFNIEARKKMKSMLLAKMAVNAKHAKDDLAAAMRKTQKEFAEAAALENQRWRKNNKRFRKTRKIIKKNKKEAAKELKMATAAQQKALSALASATNAKIKKTNKHIAENSAQIKENAKKAREDLDNAMDAFNNKMANVEEEAKKGRSKLAAQAAAQDKKFRTDANNKIKALTAKTSAEFAKTRATMAKDRAHADAQLAHTTSRMNAALSAQTALQDKRFSQTVADIATAKKEANDRVDGFKTSFNADILALSQKTEEQTKKLNHRQAQLGNLVTSNKLEQAKVNNNVNAELKRMVKVGNDRYALHLKKDKELKDLMSANKADTEKQMVDMKNQFFGNLNKIKAQMKKDREHAESSLASATSGLFKTLADNQEAQDAVNKELTEATRRAKIDAENALRDAKHEFATKTSKLHKTVKDIEKKQNSKVMALTGVVAENAIKDAAGRAQLKKVSEANKDALHSAVTDAIAKGEARALSIEKKMADINAKTRTQMNMKITTEITQLSHNIHSQITELTLETKEARAEMKKEIIYAIKSSAELAKKNLESAITWAEGKFTELHTNLDAEAEKGDAAREAMKTTIDADKADAMTTLNDAIMNQNKALLAYRNEMCAEAGVMGGVLKVGKGGKMETEASADSECPGHEGKGRLNNKLASEYDKMMANAKSVGEEMKNNVALIEASLDNAREAANAELKNADAASLARYNEVIQAVKDGVEAGAKAADESFVLVYEKMATDANEVRENLGAAVSSLNDKIAKKAAIEDERFSKTVKDIAAARAAASEETAQATRDMKAQMLETKTKLHEVENKVINEIQVVSEMIVSDKAAQHKINKNVENQMLALEKKSDTDFSASKRARGKLKAILDENKRIAQEEVTELYEHTSKQLKALKEKQNEHLLGFKQDLTKATKGLYGKLSADKVAQANAQSALTGQLDTAKAAVAAELTSAKELFESRVITLTNAIGANKKYFVDHMHDMTGVVTDWKKASDDDRADIRKVRNAMVSDLHIGIERAITIGEAKAKAVQARAIENVDHEKKLLLTTISVAVENMADNIFATVQGHHAKIADNYLSLKAYAQSAADDIADYLKKGKTKGLSSVGDLLETLAETAGEAPPAATEGEGFGAEAIPSIFSGKEVKVDGSVSKINGLVNEYVGVVGQVKDRWPMGLGKYLIGKLEIAMQGEGVLEVDKITGKAGNFVFMNAHSVGLSSKLPDFEGLAVSMRLYEQTLAGLTGTLSDKPHAGQKAEVFVPPPIWPGN